MDEDLKPHPLARVARTSDDQVKDAAGRLRPGPADLYQFGPPHRQESATDFIGRRAFGAGRQPRQQDVPRARPLQGECSPASGARWSGAQVHQFRPERRPRPGPVGVYPDPASFTAFSQAQSFAVLAALTTSMYRPGARM